MNYYIIKNDSIISNLIQIKLPEKKLKKKEAFVVFSDLGETVECPDIVVVNRMLEKELLVSDRLKELMQCYVDTMYATVVIVMDATRKEQRNYWNIHLEEVDCVLNNKVEIMMKIEEIQLDMEKIKGKYLFEIKVGKQSYLCCSLVFVENVMGKNYYGAEWVKVTTQAEENM